MPESRAVEMAANQKWGCRRSPHCAPELSRKPTSNQRAVGWGLGWPQPELQGWRAAIFEAFFQQKNNQSGLALGVMKLEHGIGVNSHVYELESGGRWATSSGFSIRV
jgi:hypothetical protein